MRAIRSRVISLTIFAIVCQVLVFGTPLAESLFAATPNNAAAQCLCDPAGHAHAMCPMHHSPAAKKKTSESNCRLSQTPTFGGDLALVLGALPEPPQAVTSSASAGLVVIDTASRLVTRSIGFEPPPPRF